MRIETGKEIEFAKLRLADIIYLIDNTRPVEGKSWEDYANGLKSLLRRQAEQAKRVDNTEVEMTLISKPIETDPELLKRLERAKGYVMTKGEREAQRKSWVIGEMMLEHPEMSREQAEAIYNRVMGE